MAVNDSSRVLVRMVELSNGQSVLLDGVSSFNITVDDTTGSFSVTNRNGETLTFSNTQTYSIDERPYVIDNITVTALSDNIKVQYIRGAGVNVP